MSSQTETSSLLKPDASFAQSSCFCRAGGLGLRSATRLRHVAHWASWVDTIKMVHERHPEVAESILVEGHNQAPNNSVENLVATGFTPPSWEELSRSTLEAPAPADEEPNQPRAESSFLNVVLPTLWFQHRSSVSRRVVPHVWNRRF